MDIFWNSGLFWTLGQALSKCYLISQHYELDYFYFTNEETETEKLNSFPKDIQIVHKSTIIKLVNIIIPEKYYP